eukprot:CAMPEP_0196818586 /NCGR_PEP_ID=MMETSP1362-20130617/66400_1 /TAXON_ID=163516 /ORGANISM="Leptocylindrus danicus, Strain CCMP1856" /LENGTH=113 /DNA_ID=CAMNT_0042196751 /DNA_START=79 /DNA_END=416 /DNA_ORIENTATION=-
MDNAIEWCIDLSLMARRRDIIQSAAGASTQHLVKVTLGKTMSKDASVRYSRWDLELSMGQQEYAALDVSLPLEVYNFLETLPDLNQRLTLADAVPGTKVNIMPPEKGGGAVAL